MSAAMPRWSLRGRLFGLLIALVALLFTAGALLAYEAQRRANDDLINASLSESGRLLLQLAQHEIEEHGLSLGVALLKSETQPGPYQFRYQIWTESMRSAYRSSDLPAKPLVDVAADGFGYSHVDGEDWRTFAAWNEAHTLQIQIAQPDRLRRELDRRALLHTGVAVAIMLSVALVLLWWTVGRSLAPLGHTTDALRLRSPDDLRPVHVVDPPTELAPILDAVNGLFARIAAALQSERRFTADAAHELRTPLAAVRATTQVLLGARDAAERADVAADLIASVDRASRLVDQLLSLARADAQVAGGAPLAPVDLALLVREQGAAHVEQAARRHLVLKIEAGAATVNGVATLLHVLLRNLIDNAIRYSPEGGTVTVRSGTHGERCLLEVIDEGPGIPLAQRGRVFDRFYRLPETSDPAGSGLGLSIAQRIADLHGAPIALEEGPQGRGTVVKIVFANAMSSPGDRQTVGRATRDS